MLGDTLKDKKIAIIVAFRNFRDEEYFVPREILEKAGAEIKTVSTKEGKAIGADGGEVEVDLLVDKLDIGDFDAIVFVGGPGCLQYLDNENSYKIIQKTITQGKVLAAICISPVILAKAGALKEKKATVWSSALDKTPIKILRENGAIYEDNSVVVDGKIITGNGPRSAKEFGQKIVEVLTSK
ncbi:DJ-1/PfpI family protein [bacterium]|nr:DJ-1/PfpI family protein [bacterium]